MTEKFFLKIDAESPDGEAVRCETSIKIACTGAMAVSVLANLLKQDESLKKIVFEAIMMNITNSIDTTTISDEEYAQHGGKIESNDFDVEL